MRHRTPRARGQPLRAVCPRNVVRLFRPLGRNWTTRIYSGRPTVRLPQTEAWAERERVPSGHNCRRQLATGRPEQIQEPGTAVPGTPIFANNAQRGGPQESPCRVLSLVLSFAPKESTIPRRGGSPITRAAVGASVPTGGRAGVCACGRTGGFPLAPSPLRIATRSNRAPHRAASPAPAPESARQSPPKGNCLRQSWRLSMQAGWLSARPPAPPSGRTRRENHRVSSQAKI